MPKELDAIVLKGLSKAPEDRYATAEEMANALRDVLARYQFSPNELRDLVRDLCQEEWQKEQSLTEKHLTGEVTDPKTARSVEENYGDFVEERQHPMTQAQPVAVATGGAVNPTWIYWLLASSAGLFLLAIILLFVRQ